MRRKVPCAFVARVVKTSPAKPKVAKQDGKDRPEKQRNKQKSMLPLRPPIIPLWQLKTEAWLTSSPSAKAERSQLDDQAERSQLDDDEADLKAMLNAEWDELDAELLATVAAPANNDDEEDEDDLEEVYIP